MLSPFRSDLSFGCLLVLTSYASAIPAPVPQSVRTDLILEAAQRQGAISVCQRSLDSELWESGGYADQMAKFLESGPPGGYSDDGPDVSPLEVIKRYATRVDDYHCTPLDATNAHCTSQNLGSKENCEYDDSESNYNDPRAVIMLKAIANFANYMISVSAEARDLGDDVSKKQAELQETFGLDPDDVANLGELGINSGPLIMASAVLGAIPGIGGILGAPLGVLIGMNNPLTSTAWEPKFDTYMEFQSLMANVSEGIEELFKQSADNAINRAPSVEKDKLEDWVKDPASLPKVLADGRWSNAKSTSLDDTGRDAISNVMHSAGVNKIWNDAGVIVVRVSKDAYEQVGDDMCGHPDGTTVPFASNIKYCDEDGTMYVLQRWAYPDQDVPGFDELGKYGLDAQTAMKNSWAWQQKHGFDHEVSPEDVEDVFGTDSKDLDPKALQVWTLPVCDLEAAETAKPINEDTTYTDCTKRDDEALCWFQLNMWCRCGVLDGWPIEKVAGLSGTAVGHILATCGSIKRGS